MSRAAGAGQWRVSNQPFVYLLVRAASIVMMDRKVEEIFLSDSDDDLYIPLAQRLNKANLIQPSQTSIVTLGDSDHEPSYSPLHSSSSVESLTLVGDEIVQDTTESIIATVSITSRQPPSTPIRRAHTLAEFSPVVSKIKKSNTPSRSKSNSNSDLQSLSSITTEFEFERPTTSQTQEMLQPIASCSQVKPKTSSQAPQKSSSQASSENSSQASTSQVGRAPIRPISSRDCYALVPSEMFGKFFKKEDLQKAFAEFEVRYVQSESSAFKHTITWMRETPDADEEMRNVPENQVLVLLDLEEIVNMVCQYLKTLRVGHQAPEFVSLDSDDSDVELYANEEYRDDFVEFSKKVSSVYPSSNITIMLTGMATYFRRIKNREQQEFRDAIRGTQSRKRKSIGLPIIREKDLLDALVYLDMKSSQIMPVGFNVRTVRIDKPDDIVVFIGSFSKSVAEAPYKKQQKQLRTMAWYAENDSKYAVDIKDIPQDIERLWKKQLEQFPKVSREVAEAIAKVYPNPCSLLQAYLMTPQSGRAALLEDIKVGRNNRRVGREISRKIGTFFNSDNPDEFL